MVKRESNCQRRHGDSDGCHGYSGGSHGIPDGLRDWPVRRLEHSLCIHETLNLCRSNVDSSYMMLAQHENNMVH